MRALATKYHKNTEAVLRKAKEDGMWVVEAANAYAEKRNRRKSA